MPNHDPRAIANEFIRLNGGSMNQMKLQKLVYFANGWNLAINNSSLVQGNIQAWDGGPVFRTIWNHIRDNHEDASGFLIQREDKKPFACILNQKEKELIEHTWKKYGEYTGNELSEMTHEPGTPWSNAYFGSGRNSIIMQSDIKSYFVELALAGRPPA